MPTAATSVTALAQASTASSVSVTGLPPLPDSRPRVAELHPGPRPVEVADSSGDVTIAVPPGRSGCRVDAQTGSSLTDVTVAANPLMTGNLESDDRSRLNR